MLVDVCASVLPGLEDRVDGSLLAAVRESQATLALSVSSAVRFSVPEYESRSVDERSLASVGRAIDTARNVREALAELTAAVESARIALTSSREAFMASVRNLASAVVSDADRQLTTTEAASDAVRRSFQVAVDRVASAQAAGRDGLRELADYAAALDALRADNGRALGARKGLRDETRGSTSAPARSYSPTEPQTVPQPPSGAATSPQLEPSPATEPRPSVEPTPSATPARGAGSESASQRAVAQLRQVLRGSRADPRW